MCYSSSHVAGGGLGGCLRYLRYASPTLCSRGSQKGIKDEGIRWYDYPVILGERFGARDDVLKLEP